MGRRKAEVSRARRRQLIQEARWIATLGRTREWTVEQIQDEILRRFGGEVFPAEARMHANGWGVSFVREALQALATQEGLDASGLQDADVLRWLRGEVYPRDSLDRLCRLFACHQARLGWPVIGNADPIDHTPTQGPAELGEALAALEPWCTRRRAEVLLELAYVKADQRDIDRAGWLAAESLTAALEARSVAGVDRVRRFRNAYERWRDTEAMKALDQRLAECL